MITIITVHKLNQVVINATSWFCDQHNEVYSRVTLQLEMRCLQRGDQYHLNVTAFEICGRVRYFKLFLPTGKTLAETELQLGQSRPSSLLLLLFFLLL